MKEKRFGVDRLRIEEIAQEIARAAVQLRDREDLDNGFFERCLASDVKTGYAEIHHRLEQIEAKSIPQGKGSGFVGSFRNSMRARAIYSRKGYGDGCDTCGGPVKTFMALTIGGWKAQIVVDMCEPCAKRLAAVVDARLEDRSGADRRKNGVLR